jgi:hypothetical protein
MNDVADQLHRLQHWCELCAWLEDQPYNASYNAVERAPHGYLLVQPGWKWQNKALKRLIIAERKRLALVYWQTGMGWRLRKDYREKLDAEEARLKGLLKSTEAA